jgi:hypothetical protein
MVRQSSRQEASSGGESGWGELKPGPAGRARRAQGAGKRKQRAMPCSSVWCALRCVGGDGGSRCKTDGMGDV